MGEAKPRQGWERKAIDLFKPLRDAGEDMRMAARHKSYKHVMSVVIPSILNDLADLVVRMYPHDTAYERWMLLTAAENLADIVRKGKKDKKDKKVSRGKKKLGEILDVLHAAKVVSEKSEPMVNEAALQPKRGWTRQVKEFLSALRKITVGMRRDADGGDYVHLLRKVVPGLLANVSMMLEATFPGKTSRQQKMLLMVADELVDLSSGVVVSDDVDPESEKFVNVAGEE